MLAGLTKVLKRTFGFNSPDSGNVFDAAGHGDRWPLSSQLWSPVSQSLAAAQPISNRADWLANNCPTAAAYLACWIDNLVATGPTIRSQHPDEATRRLLERYGVALPHAATAKAPAISSAFWPRRSAIGSSQASRFVHMPIEERRLKLRLINTEQVWRPLTRIQPNGNRIFSGIEVDEGGKAIAYWTSPRANGFALGRVPAAGADRRRRHAAPLHPGLPRRGARLLILDADRRRGCSSLIASRTSLMARITTAALFTGFIRDLDNSAGFATDAHPNSEGKPELSMEPGALRVLPPGTDVVFPQICRTSTARATSSITSCARSPPAAACRGAADLDLSDVNYSSARMGWSNSSALSAGSNNLTSSHSYCSRCGNAG